jgi:hypothetical protein
MKADETDLACTKRDRGKKYIQNSVGKTEEKRQRPFGRYSRR